MSSGSDLRTSRDSNRDGNFVVPIMDAIGLIRLDQPAWAGSEDGRRKVKMDLEFFKDYARESERGCVLLIGEALNEQLEGLHRAYIDSSCGDNKLAKLLLSWRGPLGTFGLRVQVAYAYGLLSKDTYKDLELLRSIRNGAAHSTMPFSLFNYIKKILSMGAVERVAKVVGGPTREQIQAAKDNLPDAEILKMAFASTGMAIGIEIATKHTEIVRQHICRLKANTQEKVSGAVTGG